MCFASMTGCKTKPPKVAHPYVKEYVASYKTGSVNVKDFLEHGEEFAIGADENGNNFQWAWSSAWACAQALVEG